jgi:hypothetical protein
MEEAILKSLIVLLAFNSIIVILFLFWFVNWAKKMFTTLFMLTTMMIEFSEDDCDDLSAENS